MEKENSRTIAVINGYSSILRVQSRAIELLGHNPIVCGNQKDAEELVDRVLKGKLHVDLLFIEDHQYVKGPIARNEGLYEIDNVALIRKIRKENFEKPLISFRPSLNSAYKEDFCREWNLDYHNPLGFGMEEFERYLVEKFG